MSDPKPLKELLAQFDSYRRNPGNAQLAIEMARRLRELDKTVDFYRVEFRRQSKGTTLVPLEEIRAILDGRDK